MAIFFPDMNSLGFIAFQMMPKLKISSFITNNIGISGDSVKVWAGKAQKKAEEEEVPFFPQCCAPEP